MNEIAHSSGRPGENDRWLRSAVENSSEIVTVIEPDGTLRYASPAFERLFGYDPEQAVGTMNVLDHVHPDDLPLVLEETEKAFSAAGVATDKAEYRFRHKDGTWRWVESVGVYLLEDPMVRGVVVQSRDVTERKEAEKALAESERRFSNVIADAHAFAYRCLNEPGWPNEYASDYALELTGYPPEELLVGGSVRYGDLVVEEDRDRVWEVIQEALGEHKGFQLRYSIRRRDGVVRHVVEHGRGVYGDHGEVIALEGIVHDVTDLVEVEQALAESEERYRTLVERVPAITYIHHHKPGEFSGTTYASPQVQSVLGYSQEEYTAEPEFWKSIVHPDDRERVLDEDERTGRTGEAFDLDYRMIAKNGRIVWLRESGTLVRSEGDGLQVWHGVMVDITELKRVEEDLREAEARYRTLVERVSPTIYIQRPREGEPAAYDTTYMSPRVQDVLGYPPSRFLEDPDFWDSLIYPDDRERVLAEDERTDRTGEPFAMEYRMIAKDGSVVWVRDEATLVRDESGEPLYWLGAQMDVTDRKYSEEALRDAEERYRTLVEQIPAVTYIDKADGSDEPLYTSPQIEGMLGYTPEEWMGGRLWPERLHPDDRERVLAADERFEGGEEERFSEEYRLVAKDGSVVWVREEAVLIADEAGEPLYWQGVIFDITERKGAEEALTESEAILAEAQRLAHLGSWQWDIKSDKVRWSDETFRIYGFAPQKFVPSFHRLLEVVHPEDRQTLHEHIDAALRGDEPYDLEHRIVRSDGEVRVVHRRAEVVRDEAGEPVRMLGTVHDITERKALEERLEHQALHDPLTGLPNRTLFMDRLRHALSRARRRKREVAVLFMDLDTFKVINDSLGHKVGDRVLVAASKRVQRALRPEDTVARLGGDEFILLLEGIDAAAATRAAERVLEQLRAPFSAGGRQLFVSASVGIALGGANGKSAADLLRDADLAMYRAKHSGRARYAVFEEEMNTRALERLELEHDLRRAIERGEFKVHYQPQMLLDTDLQRYLRSVGSRAVVARTIKHAPRIVAVEGLVRWEHPERGLLLPDDFIPLAEETGLIVGIGEVVLSEACRQAKEWQDRFPAEPPLAVCVNLSARQFKEPDLVETIRRILAETELDPTCLHLEITESTAMDDAPATVATLEALNGLGVRMVIDDFGTGYSSLSYLERFPVGHVKIDRSFVAKLGKEEGATALVSGMIRLAHSLGLAVIAEGVESEDHLKRLQGLGCDLAQGHYFSKPLPREAMVALLETGFSSTRRGEVAWRLQGHRDPT